MFYHSDLLVVVLMGLCKAYAVLINKTYSQCLDKPPRSGEARAGFFKGVKESLASIWFGAAQ